MTAAANKLIDMGVADPDRLGVQGTSYGGYATVLLITQTDRFKAAINISGKVDMMSFYTDSPRLGVRNTHAPEKSQDRIGGTLWEYPERYSSTRRSCTPIASRRRCCASPATRIQRARSQSREMFYALRRLGKDRVGALRQRRARAAEQRRRERRLRGGFWAGSTSILRRSEALAAGRCDHDPGP